MTKLRAALLLFTSVLVLVPACLATDAQDEGLEAAVQPVKVDRPGHGNMENMVPGPCATLCMRVAEGQCGNWRDECADNYPDDPNVDCGLDKLLTCDAADKASNGQPWGVMYCYRRCEGFRD
jgi:hypothetical protein